MERPHLSLILPAYNEVRSIVPTLDAVRAYLEARPRPYEVIVCADGTDGTREAVRDWAAGDPRYAALGDHRRRGKGRAVRLGVRRARGLFIGFMDADLKTPVDELDRVLPWLERGYDLVIGSRALADSHVEAARPLHRRLGSRAFGLLLRALLGMQDIPDTRCGFQFFRAAVARDLFARQRVDGYLFDVEVLRLALLSGYRIRQVGVRWREGDGRRRVFAGNLRNLIDLLRIRFGTSARPPAPAAPAARPARWRRAA